MTRIPRTFPAALALLASALLLPAPTSAQWDDLLQNGGAEGGVLTPWVDGLGHGFQVVAADELAYVGVTDGQYHFWAGDTGPAGPYEHEAFQEVDVSAHAQDIDAGSLDWCARAFVYSRSAGGVTSEGSVAVDLLDGQGHVLSTWTSGPPAFFDSYAKQEVVGDVPALTRTLRFRMSARRDGGQVTDAAFDQCELRLMGPPEVYCVAQVNSQGCTPAITTSGVASASDTTPFLISAANVVNNKPGLLFYGSAPTQQPLFGGTLCVAPPVTRTPVQDSGGNQGPDDCSGSYSIDFNAVLQSTPTTPPDPCATVYAQYWSRDPADASTVNLTDAVSFFVAP